MSRFCASLRSAALPSVILLLVLACSENKTLEPECEICYSYTVELQESQPLHAVRDMDFVDSLTGWAVGEDAVVLRTEDGGLHWVVCSSGGASVLYSIDMLNADSGFAVGTDGTLLRTTDTGNTWQHTTISLNHLTSVTALDRRHGFAVGDAVILKTTDYGSNWSAYSDQSIEIPLLYGVEFVNTDLGWAVGAGGTILHTNDGGIHWYPQQSEAANPLFDVDCIDASTGWAVGVGGVILHTSNGGTTWTRQSASVSVVLRSVDFHDANNGVVVGDDGTVLVTRDAGGDWEPLASGTVNTLRRAVFLTPEVICVASDFGVFRIIRTEEECCE